ncbi:MAG: hypothetical protein HN580_19470 [Deltaproteobacteria bacterium]|nr:hypothetical protein [Deltaproteobacteria bacterium]
MENKDKKTKVLLESSSQGFSISIHGKKGEDGNWLCAVENNEVILSDFPTSDFLEKIEQERRYDKTDFILSFADAFKRFDLSEWILCRPLKIEKEFAEFVLNEFEKRMDEYSEQFPAESPTEEFMRKTRRDEWRTKAAASLASKP